MQHQIAEKHARVSGAIHVIMIVFHDVREMSHQSRYRTGLHDDCSAGLRKVGHGAEHLRCERVRRRRRLVVDDDYVDTSREYRFVDEHCQKLWYGIGRN